MTQTAIKIKAEPLTAESFAPFGKIVTETRHILHCEPGQYNARLHVLERVGSAFRGINRHMDHEQLFVPLTGGRLLLVVAPPDVEGKSFDPGKVRAFVNDGTQAWTYGVGVWHFAPRGVDREGATAINVQGSQYMAHTEIVQMDPAVEVEL